MIRNRRGFLGGIGGLTLLMSARARAASQGGSQRRVAFAQDTLANAWRVAQVRGLAEAFASVHNLRFVYSDGEGSTAKQIADVEDFLDQGVDALIVSPRDSRALAPVLVRVQEAGIPVVCISREAMGAACQCLVAPDNLAIGRQAGVYLAGHLGGRGRVFILQGLPEASSTQERTLGFLDVLRQYPGIRVVGTGNGNFQSGDAIVAMEQFLERGIPFDALFFHSDIMAEGARLALRRAGVDPRRIPSVGVDYIGEARAAIRRGEQGASIMHPTGAREAARAVLGILAGREPPPKVMVPTVLVTQDNLDRYQPVL